MPQIQIDFPEDINRKLKIKKAEKGCANLKETVIKFFEEKFDEW